MRAWSLAAVSLAGTASAQAVEQTEACERRIDEQQRQIDEMQLEIDALKASMEQSQSRAKDVQAESGSQFVLRRNENTTLTLSGRVHRMILDVRDGASSELFFTDSEQGPTILRVDGTGEVDETFAVGATIETGIRQNRPFLVSQDMPDVGTDVTVRIAEAIFDSSRYGKFSLGRGFASGWLAPEMDLSETQFASLLPVGMLAPGLRFVDASTNTLSDIQVRTHFADVERLLLVNRVRYDSPSFGPGLQLSGSLANDGRWDATLRAKPEPTENWTVVGGASFQNEPFVGIDERFDAVISFLNEPTGINLTVGGAKEWLDVGREANTYIVKAGWLTDIFTIGKTVFSTDYYQANDVRVDGDKAESVGVFAVQAWPAYGLSYYAGYRRYDVSRPDIDLKALNVVALGVVLSF